MLKYRNSDVTTSGVNIVKDLFIPGYMFTTFFCKYSEEE